MRNHLVIAGGGQAAVQAAQSARQDGFDGPISLLSNEPWLPYQRPPLSKKFLAGELEAERLHLKPHEFYSTREIDVRLETSVSAIDPARHRIELADGESIDYSHLLLATGSAPRALELPGSGLAGIRALRTLADVEAIRSGFLPGRKLLIVGAGYIGLEVAAVARARGLEVTVIEAADRVMARSVCPAVSNFYADYHRQHGVELRLGTQLTGFTGEASVRAATTATGETIDSDLVVVGIGIVPCVALAKRAGLAIDNGIAVDACARTTAPGIFAAGDCTSHPHPWVGHRVRLESVHNAIEQGKAAAAAICGREDPFSAVPWFWSDQYDLKLQIAGLSTGYDETVMRGDPDTGSFSVYYLRAGRVIAVDAINDPRGFMTARKRLVDKPKWPVAAIADLDCDLNELAA
jgi:3-phenylpropionate/trans-cinnamate dioxygenase ferredoxin reductase subunit